MAKRVQAGDLDESLIIQSFKNTNLLANPADAIVRKEEDNSPEEKDKQEEQTESSQEILSESKKPTRRRKGQGNYDETFLKRKELKTRQPVYISQGIHASIIRLVHLLALAGKEISVGGYIDNVLAEHLEQHKEEITELYRKQLDNIL